jgi:thiamine monophosphate synthase
MRGPKIILVTDPAYEDDAIVDTIEAAASALPPGALGVQLRDRIREKGELARFAERLRRVTRDKDAWLVINGSAAPPAPSLPRAPPRANRAG